MKDKKKILTVMALIFLASLFNSCAIGIIDNGNQFLGANHATSTMTDTDGEVYINRCTILFFNLIKQCRIQKLKNSVAGYYILQPIYVRAKESVYRPDYDDRMDREIKKIRNNK